MARLSSWYVPGRRSRHSGKTSATQNPQAVQGEARRVFTPVALNHQLTLQRFLTHGLNGSSIASDPSSLPSTRLSLYLVAHVLDLFGYKKNYTACSQQHHNPPQGIHCVLIEVYVSVMLLEARPIILSFILCLL